MSRTAFTGGEQALLYTQPHALIGVGLATRTPESVWTGTVTAVPTFPADGTGIGQVAVTTVTGAYTAVVEGMTVVFGDMALPRVVQIYYTYARKVPSGATVLFIDGQGNGAATIAIGTKFTVLNDYIPQPRRFRYDTGSATWFCNFDTTYTDQNETFAPQAVMGCSAVIYKNGSQTFSFDGSRSKAWTSGATITTYAWTFPDATTSASSAPTWATSTAYPNGAYVHLTVTDSNGKTATGHRLIWKFDNSNKPPTNFEVTSFRMDWGGGAVAEIKSLDPLAGLGSYSAPYNHVCLFYRAAYGTTVGEIGTNHPNRANILLDGWVTESDVSQDMNGNTWTYTLQTGDGLLSRQQGFAVEIDNNTASPTTWLTMKPMTLDNVFHHYCNWRSTIAICMDYFAPVTSASGRTKHLHDVAAGTMFEQLKAHYGWLMGGQMGCDNQSALYGEQDYNVNTSVACPIMIQLIDAVSVGVRKSLVRAGFVNTSIPYYLRAVAKQTAYGIDYPASVDTPVGSRAPDDPLAHGASLEEIPAGLWGSQTELNTWAGRMRAKKDNPWPVSTYPLVGIVLICPTPQSTVTAFINGWNSGIVRGCQIEFDTEHGMMYSSLDCENTFVTNPAGNTITFDTI